jgi:NAD(P)-dependent dehydrogenase (short-subunit alcohol dehydrogenase family)
MFTLDLQGRVAVVTGGSSGIGLATAGLLLQAGAAVALCGRDTARLDAAQRQLQAQLAVSQPSAAADRRLLAQRCDVLVPEQVQAFAEAVAQRLGPADMLVNNAGQGRVSTFANTSDADWTQELQLKFFSLIHPTRAFLPQLTRSDAAAIVCVNSLLALQPEPHMVATSAARAGAQSLVRSMATEFAPQGIRVNSILIGLVESGQWRRRFEAREDRSQTWEQWTQALARSKHIPLGRLGRPEEAARAIFYLATPLSSYTTGAHLDVSGGHARHL